MEKFKIEVQYYDKGGRLDPTNTTLDKMLEDKYDRSILAKTGELLKNKQIIPVVEEVFNLSEVKKLTS